MSELGHIGKVAEMKSIIIFDIPFGEESLRRQLNRKLAGLGARKLQQSVWESDDINELINIAVLIKKSGGDARILEERFLF